MKSSKSREPNTTGVVIPFYQRTPGILRRALTSIAAQTPPVPMMVIVVDDGSPAPAKAELNQFVIPAHITVHVIEQANGGPGAARNTALDELNKMGVDFVAFLDSDDEWDVTHLSRAHSVLNSSATAYFANLRQLGQNVPAFERAGRINLSQHEVLSNTLDTYLYRGDMVLQVISGNVIGTSTVVYNRRASQAIESLRFRPEFRNAGEDYLFWIDLTMAGAKWGFSTQVATEYGAGVNIYSGAGWGTPTHFLRLHNEARYRLTLIREFAFNRSQRKMLAGKVRDLRVAMVRDLLHRIRHHKPLPWKWMADVLRSQPAIVIALPDILFTVVTSRLRKD